MPAAPIDRTKAGPAPVVPVSRARWLWLFRAGGAGRSVEWVGEEEGPGHAALPASCWGCCRAGGARRTAAPAWLALGGHGCRRCPRPAWAAAGSWWPWLERQRSPGMPSPALSGSSSGVVVVILAIILLAFIVH